MKTRVTPLLPLVLMAFLGVLTLWLQYTVLDGPGGDAKPARHDPGESQGLVGYRAAVPGDGAVSSPQASQVERRARPIPALRVQPPRLNSPRAARTCTPVSLGTVKVSVSSSRL